MCNPMQKSSTNRTCLYADVTCCYDYLSKRNSWNEFFFFFIPYFSYRRTSSLAFSQPATSPPSSRSTCKAFDRPLEFDNSGFSVCRLTENGNSGDLLNARRRSFAFSAHPNRHYESLTSAVRVRRSSGQFQGLEETP